MRICGTRSLISTATNLATMRTFMPYRCRQAAPPGDHDLRRVKIGDAEAAMMPAGARNAHQQRQALTMRTKTCTMRCESSGR